MVIVADGRVSTHSRRPAFPEADIAMSDRFPGTPTFRRLHTPSSLACRGGNRLA